MSTLEDLWNKGSLKPESYPQLIRMLQRERNTYRDAVIDADKEVARLRELWSEARSMTED